MLHAFGIEYVIYIVIREDYFKKRRDKIVILLYLNRSLGV
jgi:hypothetical protein